MTDIDTVKLRELLACLERTMPQQVAVGIIKQVGPLCDALDVALARIAELEVLETSLPRCHPWLSGSGGHKVFGECNRIATWSDMYDRDVCYTEHYCDEHLPEHYRDTDEVIEMPWADVVRGAHR